ncbi:hypothetical protein N7530_008675 [Penicillium desertorum]|uniref:3-hydroxyisobutyrate dehydrogenase n=1 Tax=Penicillium desertorum TaxID=1303715 RepID=A0A9W9WQ59_9EURO|nr:hypothetical protein N7530_008675 [Penicillium desertorum]
MGKPMAEQLATKLPSTTTIIVYDVVESVINELVEKYPGKVFAGTSPKHVVENSQTIFSMVPEGSHVRSVYLDAKTGVCSTNLGNRLLVDCSTIDTATSLEVKDYIATHHPKASFYDSPVSGGVIGAIKGTIAFFVGCAETDPNFAQLSQLLKLMGTQLIACGKPSLGLSAKLCNNYLSGLIAIANSEALIMGMKAGLDPRVLSSVFGAGTAQNTICDRFNPCPGVAPDAPSSNGYKGGFKVQLMKKDFSLAMGLARELGVELVLGAQGLKTYESASSDPKCKDLDSRVVFRHLGGDEEWAQKLNSKI